ncbi:hypothetical protein Tco_0177581, partial [Tanacetum coccineum]
MPEGVLVLSRLSRIWKSHIRDLVLRVPMEMDLAVGTPSSNIVAKAEASQKQKASTSCATSSHVAKRNSDDDYACVEILLVTLLCSATVIPSSENQSRSSTAPTAEGKGVMVDDATAPSAGSSRSRPSSRPDPSFR